MEVLNPSIEIPNSIKRSPIIDEHELALQNEITKMTKSIPNENLNLQINDLNNKNEELKIENKEIPKNELKDKKIKKKKNEKNENEPIQLDNDSSLKMNFNKHKTISLDELQDIEMQEHVKLEEGENKNQDENEELKEVAPKECTRWIFYKLGKVEKNEWAAILFEIFSIILTLTFILLFVPSETRKRLWFIPIVGIFGAAIAISTPAGGGIIFFPALSIAGIQTTNTVGFSIATQAIGMGLFGTLNWIRSDPKAILVSSYLLTTFWSCVGITFTLFLVRVENELFLHTTFAGLGLLLAFYIWYSLWRGEPEKRSTHLINIKCNHWSLLKVSSFVLVGFLGGLIIGHLGVGVDTLLFWVLTAFYQVDSHKATVTSVLTMGSSAIYSFLLQLFYFNTVPIDMWLMVLPGILIGARLGVALNKKLGKVKVLIFFSIILVAEFIRTIVLIILGKL